MRIYNTPAEVLNVMLLTEAVKTTYDIIVSVNLSKNHYNILDHGRFLSYKEYMSGEYDKLVQEAGRMIPEKRRGIFLGGMNREKLISYFEQGKTNYSMEYPEYDDRGNIRYASTTIILMEDKRTGDVVDITLVRYLTDK